MDSLSIRGKGRRASAASTGSSAGAPTATGGGTTSASGGEKETQIEDGDSNDTSTLDKEEGNVLMALIQQREFRFVTTVVVCHISEWTVY